MGLALVGMIEWIVHKSYVSVHWQLNINLLKWSIAYDFYAVLFAFFIQI